MKTFFSISFIFLLTSMNGQIQYEQPVKIDSRINQVQCPPYHKTTRETLKGFLNDEDQQDEREEMGIGSISMDEVAYLKTKTDKMACQQLQKDYPWPAENHFRTYYKSDDYYFIVDTLKPLPPPKEGTINLQTGYSVLTVLDKEFNHVGSVLL